MRLNVEISRLRYSSGFCNKKYLVHAYVDFTKDIRRGSLMLGSFFHKVRTNAKDLVFWNVAVIVTHLHLNFVKKGNGWYVLNNHGTKNYHVDLRAELVGRGKGSGKCNHRAQEEKRKEETTYATKRTEIYIANDGSGLGLALVNYLAQTTFSPIKAHLCFSWPPQLYLCISLRYNISNP